MGTCGEVLFEQMTEEGVYEGHLTNYVKVTAKSDKDISGQFVNVRLDRVEGDTVWGTLTD